MNTELKLGISLNGRVLRLSHKMPRQIYDASVASSDMTSMTRTKPSAPNSPSPKPPCERLTKEYKIPSTTGMVRCYLGYRIPFNRLPDALYRIWRRNEELVMEKNIADKARCTRPNICY